MGLWTAGLGLPPGRWEVGAQHSPRAQGAALLPKGVSEKPRGAAGRGGAPAASVSQGVALRSIVGNDFFQFRQYVRSQVCIYRIYVNTCMYYIFWGSRGVRG